jgi:hypothetical protein
MEVRSAVTLCLWLCVLSAPAALAQSHEQATAACTFEDGKQVMVRYHAVPSKEPLSRDSVWTPGGSPLFLFSQTDLELAGSQIPIGAYSLYVIPNKEMWLLIVNKNVAPASNYDKQQDIVRVAMQMAEVSQPLERLQVAFGRVAPRQCNLRFYYGKTGVFGAHLKETSQ